MRFLGVFVALTAAFTCLSPNSSAQDRREIPAYREINIAQASTAQSELHAFLDVYGEAWAQEDVETLMTLHTVDTEWTNAFARVFTTADALGAFLETRLFPAFGPGVSRREAENMTLISLRLVNEGAAVIHLYTDSDRGASAIDGERSRRTHFHLVLTRERDGWKVAHTVIMDARG